MGGDQDEECTLLRHEITTARPLGKYTQMTPPPVNSGYARKTLVGEPYFVGNVLCGQRPPNH